MNSHNSLQSITVYHIIYAQDPDGRDLNVKTSLIAVMAESPLDDLTSREKLYKSVLKKFLAAGDVSRFDEYERKLDSISAGIRQWIESKDTLEFENLFFFIQPLDVKDEQIKELAPGNYLAVCYDEEEGICKLPAPSDTILDYENVPVTTLESVPSPFMVASPFVVKEGNVYLSDRDGNAVGEPYSRIASLQSHYVVGRPSGLGLVSKSGEELLPCIYDKIHEESGNVISLIRNRLVGFYLPYCDVKCEPSFKDIEFGDGDSPMKVLSETGWGFLDVNLGFHSLESWDNGECDDVAFI